MSNAPTPHDIAQLALTRRLDPALAMYLATEAGKMTTENVNGMAANRDSADRRQPGRSVRCQAEAPRTGLLLASQK